VCWTVSRQYSVNSKFYIVHILDFLHFGVFVHIGSVLLDISNRDVIIPLCKICTLISLFLIQNTLHNTTHKRATNFAEVRVECSMMTWPSL
jgi:hypothetical protein